MDNQNSEFTIEKINTKFKEILEINLKLENKLKNIEETIQSFSEVISNKKISNSEIQRIWKLDNEFKDTFNLSHYLKLKACLDTCDYIENNLIIAEVFPHPSHLLNKGVSMAIDYDSKNSSEGLFLEFGVFSGNTVNQIAKLASNKKVYGFDSFAGLPEDWRTNFLKGTFKVNTIPKVETNVELKIGLFKDTLPEFITNTKSKMISFLHIDCDLYSSTKDVLSNCRPLIKKGTIICFDEYWNYPGWLNNEFKAWSEFCKNNKIAYRYVGYVDNFQQVLVEVI